MLPAGTKVRGEARTRQGDCDDPQTLHPATDEDSTLKMSRLLAVCAAVATLACGTAQASLIITVSDDGSDLTFDYSGSLDTSTLGPSTTIGGFAGSFSPAAGTIFGRILGNTLRYDNAILTGSPFGSGAGDTLPITLTPPDAASGTTGFILIPGQALVVDIGYVSGSVISGSLTYGGNTIASQGITPGPHIYTIAGSAETISLLVASVPEGDTLALLVGGLVSTALARKRCQRAARS